MYNTDTTHTHSQTLTAGTSPNHTHTPLTHTPHTTHPRNADARKTKEGKQVGVSVLGSGLCYCIVYLQCTSAMREVASPVCALLERLALGTRRFAGFFLGGFPFACSAIPR